MVKRRTDELTAEMGGGTGNAYVAASTQVTNFGNSGQTTTAAFNGYDFGATTHQHLSWSTASDALYVQGRQHMSSSGLGETLPAWDDVNFTLWAPMSDAISMAPVAPSVREIRKAPDTTARNSAPSYCPREKTVSPAL